MSAKSIRELVDEHFESDSVQLPVFNPVALELRRMRDDEELTVARVTQVIMRDQALASRVLHVANSSFFGGLTKADTISRAVVRLGMNPLCSLVMVAAQMEACVAKMPMVSAEMPALWARSYASAVGARWLAVECALRQRAEEAFLAGLLHDIGELFLLKVIDRLASAPTNPLPITAALMREILEAMHAEIGYRLLRKWELPEIYARVARDHHLSEFDDKEPLLAIVRLVDTACSRLGIGQPADPAIALGASPEAQALGLKEIKLAELEVLLEDKMAEASAMSH